MVRVLVPEGPPAGYGMGESENALATVTAGVTVNVAVTGEPFVAPCVVVSASAEIVLIYEPLAPTGAFTVTVIVQEELAGIVPPDKLTVRGRVIEAVPLGQVVPRLVSFTTVNGLSNVSVMLALVRLVVVGLVNVMVNVLVPPALTVDGENALATVTAGFTVMVAAPGEPFDAPCPVLRLFAGIVLVYVPDVALNGAVTLTVSVQLPLAGTVAPLMETVEAPAVAVMVGEPPQVVELLGEAATTNGLGKNESERPTAV
jgi:hypothetical protein